MKAIKIALIIIIILSVGLIVNVSNTHASLDLSFSNFFIIKWFNNIFNKNLNSNNQNQITGNMFKITGMASTGQSCTTPGTKDNTKHTVCSCITTRHNCKYDKIIGEMICDETTTCSWICQDGYGDCNNDGSCECSGSCVNGACCGDGTCASGKEDCGTCKEDCGCSYGYTCVDGQCRDSSYEPNHNLPGLEGTDSFGSDEACKKSCIQGFACVNFKPPICKTCIPLDSGVTCKKFGNFNYGYRCMLNVSLSQTSKPVVSYQFNANAQEDCKDNPETVTEYFLKKCTSDADCGINIYDGKQTYCTSDKHCCPKGTVWYDTEKVCKESNRCSDKKGVKGTGGWVFVNDGGVAKCYNIDKDSTYYHTYDTTLQKCLRNKNKLDEEYGGWDSSNRPFRNACVYKQGSANCEGRSECGQLVAITLK